MNIMECSQILNIPSEKVLAILMKQAYINATLIVFVMFVSVLLVYITYRLKEQYKDSIHDVLSYSVYCVAIAFMLIMFVYAVPIAVTILFNPDYLPIERLSHLPCGVR